MVQYFFTKVGYHVEETLGNNGQNSLILLVEYLLPTVFVGIYMVVILVESMSTVDSLSASSVLFLDIKSYRFT
ncbi:MAG: hypothetical protein ACKVLJ_06175 [Cytophagales bacterium]|tara:strand:- start:7620 stop:7838 length:219 start_codon:yes stop_codon:yes gene_type:complete